MSKIILEVDPRIAARDAFVALREAGRHSGRGLNTVRTRTSRRALVVGAEGARRGGLAWTALRGVQPPRRRGTVALALAAGFSAGVAVALVVQRGVGTWRALGSDVDSGAGPVAGPVAGTDSGVPVRPPEAMSNVTAP
jgi:hypothetical protein